MGQMNGEFEIQYDGAPDSTFQYINASAFVESLVVEVQPTLLTIHELVGKEGTGIITIANKTASIIDFDVIFLFRHLLL